jgi:integrase
MRWIANGRQVQESTRFRVDVKADRAKALALLDERTEIWRLKNEQTRLRVLIAQAQSVEERIKKLQAVAAGAKPVTLGEFVEAWKESPRRKDCSAEMLERYESQIRQFVAWAGDGVDVRAVDDDMAERYAKHLAKMSGNTYNKHLNTLEAAWRAAGRSAGTEANPWAELPRKRQEAHRRRNLSREEIAALLSAAEGEWRGLIETGLHTGLRLGDACRLTWDAFRGDGTVEVATGKTGAVVRLPSAGLLAALGMAGRALPSGYVLPEIAAIYTRDPATVSKRIGQIFERAGIERKVKEKGWSKARADAGFHSLRHTFVTRAIEAGVPAAIVRALVGHATAAMTDRYTHISGEAVAAAFEKAGL